MIDNNLKGAVEFWPVSMRLFRQMEARLLSWGVDGEEPRPEAQPGSFPQIFQDTMLELECGESGAINQPDAP